MKYKKYEALKRRLQTLGLSPSQYETIVQIIAEALGV